MKIAQRKIAKRHALYSTDFRAARASRRLSAAWAPLAKSASAPPCKDNFNELPQLVWRTDPAGQCTYVNQTFQNFLGISAEALIRGSWAWFLHPDDATAATDAWLDSVCHNTVHQAQYRIRRHDNTYRWMLARAVMVKNAAGQVSHWVGTNTDVHEFYQAMDARREKFTIEQDFIRSCLHALRTPLAMIELNAELALGHPDEQRRVAQNFRAIIRDVSRIDATLTDLLANKSSQDAAPPPTCPPSADLRNVVLSATRDLAARCRAPLTMDITEQSVLGVWNAGDLQQSLGHLVGHAIRYSHPNSPIHISLAYAHGLAMLSVHHELSTRDGRAASFAGDLPAVKQMAAAHGGFVHVESSSAQGTTVRVVLPVTQAQS